MPRASRPSRRSVVVSLSVLTALGGSVFLAPPAGAQERQIGAATGALTDTDPVTSTRLFRDGTRSTCTGKAFPTTSGSGSFRYDLHTFQNPDDVPACITVTLSTSCPLATAPIFATAYAPTFNPVDFAENYLGDPGSSPTPEAPESFAVRVGPRKSFQVHVGEVMAGTGCAEYALKLTTSVPSLGVSDVTTTEGNAGTSAATFTVQASHPAAEPYTVEYATENATASGDADFDPVAGRLLFAAGETTATVTVPVRGDSADEPDETYRLRLFGADAAVLTDPLGIGTILDDDAAPTPPTPPAPPVVAPDPAAALRTAKASCKRAVIKKRRGARCRITGLGAGAVTARLERSGRVLGKGTVRGGSVAFAGRRPIRAGRHRLVLTLRVEGVDYVVSRNVRLR